MTTDTLFLLEHESPCGTLVLGTANGAIYLCDWSESRFCEKHIAHLCRALHAGIKYSHTRTATEARRQLDEYFLGKRTAFNIPRRLVGTEFQLMVWNAIALIPYGSTASYSSIAAASGMPKAVRAVANATGANPMSIIVPCHRVTGLNGALTGYAGGLDAKQYLLRLENDTRNRIICPCQEPRILNAGS